MLLKTNEEGMSVFRLATIFMKTPGLRFACHEIDENTGS
jgi:hypothetical protein